MSITIALSQQYDVQLKRLGEELSRIMTDAERASEAGVTSDDVESVEQSARRQLERNEPRR